MDHSNDLTCDIECYKNYLLVMFKKITTGQVMYFEKFNDSTFEQANVLYILNKYRIVTFNGNKYDKTILEIACAGLTNASMHKASNMLIVDRKQPWEVRKYFDVPALWFNHIDLIEVAPLKGSLKIYGGRLHAKTLQDLPIEPDATIVESDRLPMRKYCENDLDLTELLLRHLEKQLDLRERMSAEYNIDLMSKSDAQIAEAVIKHELKTKYNITPKRPKLEAGKLFKYNAPEYIAFETEQMQEIFKLFTDADYAVGKNGHMELPSELKNKKFKIGNTPYKIGIGGLHSAEKKAAHVADGYILNDIDVESYYPRVMLNNNLYPKSIGERFLEIYEGIVNRRLKAKKEGRKDVSDSLKITINGTFGKLASKWSFLFAPDMMMHVTITGQLSLFMLIERLELAGVPVVSGNTDGIVVKMLPEQVELVHNIVEEWEFDTDYKMEYTNYKGLYSRDVNNYIAIGDDKVKAKGAYGDSREPANLMKKNPSNEICSDAVKAFLSDGVLIADTVRGCDDITKFTTLRTVNGGAMYDGKLVGKAIRWYYGSYELDAMYYKTNGNKVPRSDGAVPVMDLPDELPDDIDYDWYIAESNKILTEIGV